MHTYSPKIRILSTVTLALFLTTQAAPEKWGLSPFFKDTIDLILNSLGAAIPMQVITDRTDDNLWREAILGREMLVAA